MSISIDQVTKRPRHTDDSPSEKSPRGKDGGKGIQVDYRLSILEQRIHELQTFSFDLINSADSHKLTAVGNVYSDPLINLEIAVLRQKEDILTKRVLQLQLELGKYQHSTSFPSILTTGEIDEKKKKSELSMDNIHKQLELKDSVIAELIRKLQEERLLTSELQAENDNLLSQIFLMQQAKQQQQQQQEEQDQQTAPMTELQNPDNIYELQESVLYSRLDNYVDVAEEKIQEGDESPVLQIED